MKITIFTNTTIFTFTKNCKVEIADSELIFTTVIPKQVIHTERFKNEGDCEKEFQRIVNSIKIKESIIHIKNY